VTGHQLFALGRAELDITDLQDVRRAFDRIRPEIVIHAAAWTDTAGCEANPDRAMMVNGEGSRLLAEACRRAGAALLYISTNEVFDGRRESPYREGDDPNPLNAYARSKLAGERHVQSLLERHWIVRTAWLYGPGRVSFPEKIIQAARRQGRLQLVSDEIASPTWTVDLAKAIARLIEQEAWGVYHLTNSGHCSRLEWGLEILRLAGLADIPVESTTQQDFGAPYRKPAFSALANRRAARLGIALPPWQEALQKHLSPSALRQSGGP
jgi:dTDP-4-dehydrorhamnose reductase